MKTCYLDANLLLYFNNPKDPFHSQADLILSKLVNIQAQLLISSLTLDEYFHNTLRFANLPRKEALKLLIRSFQKLVKLPNIQLINPGSDLASQKKVLNFMAKYQLRARDAYHLFIMLENKVKFMVTFILILMRYLNQEKSKNLTKPLIFWLPAFLFQSGRSLIFPELKISAIVEGLGKWKAEL